MERYSQLLLAQKCINIRYSVYLLLNKFIFSYILFLYEWIVHPFIKRNWFISHFECSLWMKCGWKQCFLFVHTWIIRYVHPKWKILIFFFFFSSFWFWSLEMQMETIFTLYMNHSWFKAEEDWILLLIKVSLSCNTLFHPISLSFLNTFRKNSHLIHLAHCHSRVTPRVIQQQSSHYFSSSHLQSILHQKCIPQITSLLSKRIDLYTEWPIFRPKYTRARNKSVGKAFGERARVVGDVNATKNT